MDGDVRLGVDEQELSGMMGLWLMVQASWIMRGCWHIRLGLMLDVGDGDYDKMRGVAVWDGRTSKKVG